MSSAKEKPYVIPRAKGSAVLDDLSLVLADARELDAIEYAVVLRGRDGVLRVRLSGMADRFAFIGMLEAMKFDLLDGSHG